MKDRSTLTTEQRNPRSSDLDTQSTLRIVDIINEEDAVIASAVRKERRDIARAVELIVKAFRNGGRLFYVGAGTSGRLGVLDASECPPTYGVPRTLVQGIIAGGRRALVRSVEGAEDSPQDGAKELAKRRVRCRDVVVGIAACGITPFVHGAMAQAARAGASTVFVTCAAQSKKLIKADVIINPVVGPEVITGSTRMKAGTATKLVLNTLTTAAMVKTGKVHGNLMVDLRATNAKLRDRSERIVMHLTGLSRPAARRLLTRADGRVKPAVVMHHLQCGMKEALKILNTHNGSLRQAISR
jgi:N-acetylmuramic acid 6-phosphate etherase